MRAGERKDIGFELRKPEFADSAAGTSAPCRHVLRVASLQSFLDHFLKKISTDENNTLLKSLLWETMGFSATILKVQIKKFRLVRLIYLKTPILCFRL